jgi:hypothetical protein
VSKQFAYVSTDNVSSTFSPAGYLYGFSIDQASGRLMQANTANDGIYPYAQVLTPSGKFLYVGQGYRGTQGIQSEIVAYKVNADCTLASLSQAPQQTADDPATRLIMSPTGNFLYHGGASGGRIFAIDQNTGALSLTASYPPGNYRYHRSRSEIPYSPIILSAGTFTLLTYAVNPTTGALAPLSSPQTSSRATQIYWRLSGRNEEKLAMNKSEAKVGNLGVSA